MRKTDLLNLPVAVPNLPALDGSPVRYIACARLRELNEKPILVVDAFDATATILLHRVFVSKHEYATVTFSNTVQGCKWRTAGIYNVLVNDFTVYRYPHIWPVFDTVSSDAASRFFSKEIKDDDLLQVMMKRIVCRTLTSNVRSSKRRAFCSWSTTHLLCLGVAERYAALFQPTMETRLWRHRYELRKAVY